LPFVEFIYLFLFSLVNPLDLGVVNLTLRGFCSDEMEDGTEKLLVDVLIKRMIFTAQVFAEFVVHGLKVYAELAIYSSGVYSWSMTAHSSAHKSRFYLPCDGVFLFFWKGESSALAILLKAEEEPLPRKMTINFSLRRPQHVLSG